MSFILDALKKSESDRQRQNGPALFEVKVAPPRTRLPLWAVAIAALLVVNLGIVMWMVLRHPARAAAEEAAPPAGPAAAAAAASAPAGAAEAMPAAAVSTTPVAPLSAAATQTAAVSPPATAATSTTGGAGNAAEESNPEDYAPAHESPAAPAHESAATALGNHVRRGTAEGVPLYQDAAATPGAQIPQLRLDLHAFAARPQDRFVLINMHKLREGDSLPEGVRVDSITPDGAILSYNGSRFLLPRE